MRKRFDTSVILKGMVMFMKLKLKCRRLAAMLMSVLLAGANIAPVQLKASAANTRFITELRVMANLLKHLRRCQLDTETLQDNGHGLAFIFKIRIF